MVTGSEDAGDEGEANDNIEPLLHDLAVDAGEFDEQKTENAAHDELPDAFHPEVNDLPAVERIQRLVVERDHARQIE